MTPPKPTSPHRDYIARRSRIVAGAKSPSGSCRMRPAFTTLNNALCTSGRRRRNSPPSTQAAVDRHAIWRRPRSACGPKSRQEAARVAFAAEAAAGANYAAPADALNAAAIDALNAAAVEGQIVAPVDAPQGARARGFAPWAPGARC